MNRKSSLAEKVRDFVEGKGFYVVVLVCVAAVGVSGWYLIQSMMGTGETTAPVSATAQVDRNDTAGVDNDSEQVDGPAEITVAVTPTLPEETTTPAPVTEPEPSSAPVEEPDTETGSNVPLVFTWPVKGEILSPFSVETLAYDETMGDWRVHAGLDIAAEPGTNVVATAAGTVSAVDQDDLMGTTVVIDHGDGMVSTYSNLQAVPTVEVGDSVYTGTVIGAVGSTAVAESALASHLHFQLTQDGLAVDPLDYLPAQ